MTKSTRSGLRKWAARSLSGPQLLAGALERMDPTMRKQIEASLGRTTAALVGGAGAEGLLKMMQARRAGGASSAGTGARSVLSLDKNWHGVHFVLCGKVEPDESLASQAVMGGVALGDEDDEGFSGYGPARYFTADQVTALSQLLSRPELEEEAERRFDAPSMAQLGIYPGWRTSDLKELMDAFRRLRDFYADAARNGRAIVTCLV